MTDSCPIPDELLPATTTAPPTTATAPPTTTATVPALVVVEDPPPPSTTSTTVAAAPREPAALTLPVTGPDPATLLLAGALLIVGGILVPFRGRR